MAIVDITCSRCLKNITNVMRNELFTGGYYEVATGEWAQYANPGEIYLCDHCMHNEPRYAQVYGSHTHDKQ